MKIIPVFMAQPRLGTVSKQVVANQLNRLILNCNFKHAFEIDDFAARLAWLRQRISNYSAIFFQTNYKPELEIAPFQKIKFIICI
jgi:hypothetical protein